MACDESARSGVCVRSATGCLVGVCAAGCDRKEDSHEGGDDEEGAVAVETGGEIPEAGMATVELRATADTHDMGLEQSSKSGGKRVCTRDTKAPNGLSKQQIEVCREVGIPVGRGERGVLRRRRKEMTEREGKRARKRKVGNLVGR